MGPAAYQSMVSARSRRLRTIGLLLLVAILGMSVYGFSSLMPAVRRQAAAYHRDTVAAQQVQAETGALGIPARSGRARKAMLAQVTLVYAYWCLCGLLILALLLVAWLDLREVTRNYANQRRAVWMEAASRLRDRDSANEE
ncbi:MAG TPA: hypothetical protein VKT32_08585 [Chthonomonadaceae bacterium]|nr:hypothetical protein [Chthonomonadaceae bacterium]